MNANRHKTSSSENKLNVRCSTEQQRKTTDNVSWENSDVAKEANRLNRKRIHCWARCRNYENATTENRSTQSYTDCAVCHSRSVKN